MSTSRYFSTSDTHSNIYFFLLLSLSSVLTCAARLFSLVFSTSSFPAIKLICLTFSATCTWKYIALPQRRFYLTFCKMPNTCCGNLLVCAIIAIPDCTKMLFFEYLSISEAISVSIALLSAV